MRTKFLIVIFLLAALIGATAFAIPVAAKPGAPTMPPQPADFDTATPTPTPIDCLQRLCPPGPVVTDTPTPTATETPQDCYCVWGPIETDTPTPTLPPGSAPRGGKVLRMPYLVPHLADSTPPNGWEALLQTLVGVLFTALIVGFTAWAVLRYGLVGAIGAIRAISNSPEIGNVHQLLAASASPETLNNVFALVKQVLDAGIFLSPNRQLDDLFQSIKDLEDKIAGGGFLVQAKPTPPDGGQFDKSEPGFVKAASALNLTTEQRAAAGKLDPNASNDPAHFDTATGKPITPSVNG